MTTQGTTQVAEKVQGTAPPNLSGEPEFKEEIINIPAEENKQDGEQKAAETQQQQTAEEEDGGQTQQQLSERKRRGPRRYATLTHERDEARRIASEIQQQLERERELRLAADKKAAEASDVAMETFAAKAESDMREARAFHSAALDSGDNLKITEAAERLAAATATMNDVQAMQKTKKTKEEREKAAQPAQQQQQTQQRQPEIPTEIRTWMGRNTYFSDVARDEDGRVITDQGGRPLKNAEFDKEMHIAATMYASRLEARIESGREKFAVNSDEYFDAIDKYMKGEFPDWFGGEQNEEEPSAPAMRRQSSPVAPAVRTNGQSGTNGAQTQTQVKLSADEIRFITKMVENGAGPKYPKGHAKQMQPMNLADAKVSFVRQKQMQALNK